jgi:predicted PurR-regulated permease PerM
VAEPVQSNLQSTVPKEYTREARLKQGALVLQIIVLGGVALLGLVYFFERIHTVTTIIIGSIFLFYVIYPAVKALSRRLPLWAAILIVYVVLIALVVGALAYFIPELSNNVKQFSRDLPNIARHIQSLLSNPHNPLFERLPAPVKDFIIRLPSQFAAQFRGNAGEVTSNALHTVVSLITFLALFIIIPVATIYMLMDRDRFRDGFLSIVSPEYRPKVTKLLREIHEVLAGYIRGQVLVAIIIGAMMTALLSGLHVPYAAALGVLGGFLEIIPYAGAIAGGALAVLAALISNGPLNAAFVVVGLTVINQLEGHIISPLVVGESVKLRPLTIMLALLTGAELFGILGVLVAVPVAGILKVLIANVAGSTNRD